MIPVSSHRLVSLAFLALAAAALTGCGAALGTDADRADGPVASRGPRAGQSPDQAPSSSPPASPDASQGSAVTASPTDDTATDTAEDTATDGPGRSAGAPATLPERLLTAEELPGLSSGLAWKATGTSRREPRALAGTCHRFGMLSVGAMRVAHRAYAPADGSEKGRANELVATFADPKTAWRAFEVLKSWRADCDARLDAWSRHEVGPLRSVRTAAGEAHSYLLTYGTAEGAPDSSHFDAEGLAMVGNRIAVLRIHHVGQDYAYADRKEPIDAAVRAAAAKLR